MRLLDFLLITHLLEENMSWNWKEQLAQNEIVKCANCRYEIKNSVYGCIEPKSDTPPEYIHRWENRQCYDYSVRCPKCNHYTIAVHVGR